MERRAAWNSRRGPQPSAVIFHDRLADRQAHTHPARLGREERVKNALRNSRVDPGAGVLHNDSHLAILGALRFDRQDASAVRHRRHGIDRVHNEIEYDLLQLTLIALYWRNVII